jgi:hypothetical protein
MEAMCRAQAPALRHLSSDPLTQQHLATWLEELLGERGGTNEHVLLQLLKLLQVRMGTCRRVWRVWCM